MPKKTVVVDESNIHLAINKSFDHPGLVSRPEDMEPVEMLKTGIWSIDAFVGGIPKGRISLVAGDEGLFKTSMALQTIAGCVGNSLYISAEHSFDPNRATELGIDLDKIWLVHPATMEEAYDVIDSYLDTGIELDIIVVDSVAAMTTESEAGTEASDTPMIASRARGTNRFIRKLNRCLCKPRAPAVLLIQHMMSTVTGYGKGWEIPCGKEQRYLNSLFLRLSRETRLVDENRTPIGWDIQWIADHAKIPIIRNKGMFRFFTTNCTYNGVNFKQGEVDNLYPLINEIVLLGIVQQKGAWYSIEGERVQGQAALREHIKKMLADPDIFGQWMTQITRGQYEVS